MARLPEQLRMHWGVSLASQRPIVTATVFGHMSLHDGPAQSRRRNVLCVSHTCDGLPHLISLLAKSVDAAMCWDRAGLGYMALGVLSWLCSCALPSRPRAGVESSFQWRGALLRAGQDVMARATCAARWQAEGVETPRLPTSMTGDIDHRSFFFVDC